MGDTITPKEIILLLASYNLMPQFLCESIINSAMSTTGYANAPIICTQSETSHALEQFYQHWDLTTMKNNCTSCPPNLNISQSMLLELISEGLMLISHNSQPIYLNIKAREICDRLWNSSHQTDTLPPVISTIYRQLNSNLSSQDKVFLMDYQIAGEQTIRIRACYLPVEVDDEPNVTSGNCSWLLVLLEDRDAILQEELRIEQKKYNLTKRELEVLTLLLKSSSYQQIAQKLLVSLNTVKFHVKNINFKKDSNSQQRVFQIN